jgi:hypothetical protein
LPALTVIRITLAAACDAPAVSALTRRLSHHFLASDGPEAEACFAATSAARITEHLRERHACCGSQRKPMSSSAGSL